MIMEANLQWRYLQTESNLIMPWYTLPCLQWLEKQDVKNWNVFEYGCGYSTIWWTKNCNIVNSVDDNKGWVLTIGSIWMDDEEGYVKCIEGNHFLREIKKYDCIIVDGEWREECVEFCRPFLKPGGFLIVDNYNQEGFPSADKIDSLLEGWTKQVFKQYNHSSWSTAVFQKTT